MERSRRLKLGLVGLLALAGPVGCVERRYTIRSDPPGAQVVVSGEGLGTTPVSRAYTFYGKRNIALYREGYEPMEVVQDFPAPLYDNLVTEFFTENLSPYTWRDERNFTYKMTPVKPVDQNQLVDRADALRSDAKTLPPDRPGGIKGFFGIE